MYNGAKELYCDATVFVFWFFIVYLPKKKNENWNMAQGSMLLHLFTLVITYKSYIIQYIYIHYIHPYIHYIDIYYYNNGNLSFANLK